MYLDVSSDNSFETNCWLIGGDSTDEAVVVDPGFSPAAVHRMLELEARRPEGRDERLARLRIQLAVDAHRPLERGPDEEAPPFEAAFRRTFHPRPRDR